MRILIATLVLALGAASPAFAQKTDPTEPAVVATGYNDQWRRNFMEGCLEGPNGVPLEICECGLRSIERFVPFADSDALDRAAAAGRPVDPRTQEAYRQILIRCIEEREQRS